MEEQCEQLCAQQRHAARRQRAAAGREPVAAEALAQVEQQLQPTRVRGGGVGGSGVVGMGVGVRVGVGASGDGLCGAEALGFHELDDGRDEIVQPAREEVQQCRVQPMRAAQAHHLV